MDEERGSFDALRRWSVVGLGGLTLGVPLAYTAFVGGSEISQTLLLSVPVALGVTLVAFGTWIARSDYDTGAIQRITAWSLGGLLVIGTLGLWEGYLHVLQGTPALEAGHEVMIDGATGAGIGSIVGFYDVRQRSQRRLAEEAQESLEEYREIFEKVEAGISLNDPETGTVGEVNQRWVDMLGYSREEVRDMTIQEISAEDPSFDQTKANTRIQRALEGEPQTFDWLLKHKDGSQFWVEVSLKATTIGGEPRVLALIRDIGDRRERERQIREQKRQLGTIIENVPVILFAFDDDAVITLSEGQGLSSLGLDPGELVGESIFEAYADVPSVVEAAEAALEGEAVNETVTIGETVLDTWFTPIVEKGTVDRVIGTAMDVTDRYERERQLAELHDASRRLTYANNREEVAETTVEIAEDVLEMPVSTLWRYDEESDCLHAEALTESSEEFLEIEDVDDLDPIIDGELGMEAFREGGLRAIEDYQQEENRAFDLPFGSVLLVPLEDQGLLEVGQLTVEPISEAVRQRAAILGLNAKAALDRIDRERELERSQEQFRALSENSPVGIITIDDSSTVQFANQAIGDILGYDTEDVVGESLTTVVPERLRAEHLEGIQRYLDTGERNLDWGGIELPAKHHDGHEVDVQMSFGELKLEDTHLFTGLVRDISERKRQERQLRALQQATIELADASTVAEIQEMAVEIASEVLNRPISVFWTYDSEQDVLVPRAMSDAVAQFSRGEDIDGAPVYEDGSPEMRSFRSGEMIVADEYQNLEGSGDLPLGTSVIAPVGDYGVLGFATRDVQAISETDTYLADILSAGVEAALDRTTHEELLRERTEQLEVRTSQMEFINSIIRHDVLNGMTVIRSRAEFMSETLDGQDREYAETIVQWCDNITGLAERVQTVVKTLSSKEPIDLEPIDVGRLVDEELTRLQQTYPGVTFERDLPAEVLVRADELLADVIGNVATNAIEHNDREDLEVTVSARIEDGNALVRIADNGKGIPSDELESVFRRGESHAKTAGSGFGLFFVDAMMEAYGGNVWAENDDGAVFVLELQTADDVPKTDGTSLPMDSNE